MCHHGSTVNYELKDDKIVPIFDKRENESIEAKNYLNNLNKSIKLYTNEFSKNHLLMRKPRLLIRNYGFSSLKILIKKPERKESVFFSSFVVGNNLNDNEYLVKYFSIISFLKTKYINNLKGTGIFWIEGSVSYTYGSFGLRFFELLSRIKKTLK
jgi:hypothetical protein